MFDIQKLELYKKAKLFYIECKSIPTRHDIEMYVKDQLSRASFSIPLNIAEGSAKFSPKDRRNYFITARGSLFECVSILDILNDENSIDSDRYFKLLNLADEISRMLYATIKNLN